MCKVTAVLLITASAVYAVWLYLSPAGLGDVKWQPAPR